MNSDDKTLRRSDAVAVPEAGPRDFGRYRLIERIGRGGWGEVWRAHDPALDRPVAVKLLVGGVGEEERARFAREAQVVARLQHPNIVAVFDYGRAEGVDFIAMQFVDGAPLSKLRLPIRDAVAALRDAARAVEAAHRQGLIHRDLKPANLMIEARTGRPFVLDFGLARTVEGGSSISVTGAVMGTPQYMPPEQAEGRRGIDARADVYGLGATLYEVVTGQPPFDGESAVAILRKVLEDDPVAPRRIAPRLDADVEVIVLKAMEKDPARRYASAADFADDLDRHLRGDPITARPAGVAYRLYKRVRKRPLTYALGVFLVLAAAFGAVQLARAVKAEHDGRRAAEDALRATRLAAAVDRALGLLQDLDNVLDSPDVAFADIEPIAKAIVAMSDDALRTSPKEWKLWFYRGTALLHLGDDGAAERSFTRAIDLKPADGRPHFERGMIYMRRFQTALYGWSDEQRTRNREKGKKTWLPKAKADFDAAGPLLAQDSKTLIVLWLKYADNDLPSVEKEATARIARGGRTGEVFLIRGLARSILQRREDAMADYGAAIDRRPGLWHAHYHHGNLELMSGRHREALADFDAALRINPKSALAYGNRGMVHIELGDLDAAFADYSAAIRCDPAYAAPYGDRAIIHGMRGRFDEALRDLALALERDDGRADVYNTRGTIYLQQQKYDQALADFTEALARNSIFPIARGNRAKALYALGRADEALQDANLALDLQPTFVDALIFRGSVLHQKGRYAEALADYRKAVAEQPAYAEPLAPSIKDCESKLRDENDF